MTEQEAYDFIDKELRPLWPDWDLPDAAIPIWVRNLKSFDYSICRSAVQDFYATREGSFRRPKLYGIIKTAEPCQEAVYPSPKPEKIDPQTDVFIQCIEHENTIKKYQFFGVFVKTDKQDDRDYVLRCAEGTRQQSHDMYGGSWIIVQQTNNAEMREQMQEYRRVNKI